MNLKICPVCETEHDRKGIYCCDACKQIAYRIRKRGGEIPPVKKIQRPKKKRPKIDSEKYLEEYLESHCSDQGWKLIGRQFVTDVGRIDLLVREGNDFLVIELKNKKSTDFVIGQIARYMGWVKEHLAKGKPVKGLIITKKADRKLIMASKAFDNLEVKEFEVCVTLK